MVHYLSQLLLFGPLIHSWTMRLEAKLSVIKRAGRHGNICYTVAKQSVHLLCYHLNSCGQGFLLKKLRSLIQRTQLTGTKNLHNIIMFILVTGELYPKYGKCVDMFTFRTDIVHVQVYIQECDTLYFNSHFNAFVIKVLPTYIFRNIRSLPNYPVPSCTQIIHQARFFFVHCNVTVCVC